MKWFTVIEWKSAVDLLKNESRIEKKPVTAAENPA